MNSQLLDQSEQETTFAMARAAQASLRGFSSSSANSFSPATATATYGPSVTLVSRSRGPSVSPQVILDFRDVHVREDEDRILQSVLLKDAHAILAKNNRGPMHPAEGAYANVYRRPAVAAVTPFSQFVMEIARRALPQVERVELQVEVDPEDGQQINVVVVSTRATPDEVLDAEDHLYEEVQAAGRASEWTHFAMSYEFVGR